MSLSAKQRAHLRSLAHHLKATIHVGKEGVTDSVRRSLQEAFNTRELLKVKVQESAPLTAREGGEQLAGTLPGVEHVQTIGRTVVLFRRHPEKPEIELEE